MGGMATKPGSFAHYMQQNSMKMKQSMMDARSSNDPEAKKRALAGGFGAFPMMLGESIRQFGEQRGASGAKWDKFVKNSDKVRSKYGSFFGNLGG